MDKKIEKLDSTDWECINKKLRIKLYINLCCILSKNEEELKLSLSALKKEENKIVLMSEFILA